MTATTPRHTSRPSGFILWEGASALDGSPIALIATGLGRKTKNVKTGNMIQTWIIRTDMAPTVAVAQGLDYAVCGDCPHRGQGNGKGRSCYVTVFQAPLAVFKAYTRCSYPFLPYADYAGAFGGRLVRMGAYGDPMAAPAGVWHRVAEHAKGWTGYTHQHANPMILPTAKRLFRVLIMASCDTAGQATAARSEGWRTFRTMLEDETTTSQERLCPSEAADMTCADCRRCRGTDMGACHLKSIAIHVHGSGATNYAANCRA